MSKAKLSQSQRKTRRYQIIFGVVSIIVLLSMILSLVIK
jgi:predicted nucleic acid-binding Zn ribbon protein